MSPMWNGWLASGSVLPGRTGIEVAARRGEVWFALADRVQVNAVQAGLQPVRGERELDDRPPVPCLRSVKSAVPVMPRPLMSAWACMAAAFAAGAGDGAGRLGQSRPRRRQRADQPVGQQDVPTISCQ